MNKLSPMSAPISNKSVQGEIERVEEDAAPVEKKRRRKAGGDAPPSPSKAKEKKKKKIPSPSKVLCGV